MLGKRFTIIGGSGGMGKVFGRFFKKHGFAVTLFARNEEKLKKAAIELSVNYEISLEKSVKNADIVMISIPISSTPDAVFKALTEIKNDFPVNCISLHPMFGPGIKDMKNYFMMVIKIGGTDQYDELINDLLLTRYTGTTFLLQKVFAESIIQREMEMFGEIQMENKEFLKILDLFEKLLHKYKKIIEEKNIIGFNEIFSQSLEYSKEDNYFENSYKYFYEFMNILKRENEK